MIMMITSPGRLVAVVVVVVPYRVVYTHTHTKRVGTSLLCEWQTREWFVAINDPSSAVGLVAKMAARPRWPIIEY